ncbi:MAG: glutathione S-transferase family protein [Paracoccaceae bacterium]|nr:glutathione S-transferase family protein [Paracoccaceae bacterium]MDG1369091.1 glutathione S-transferase family protein [Paracoccaceae bacterium]
MYKLLGNPKTRAGRVMWMLEELGVDYDINPCGPHDPAVAAVNPTGKIPALIDGDTVINDSTAILLHLGDKHQKLTYPLGSPERAQMMSVIFFATDAIEQPLWTFAKHSFVYPENVRVLDAVRPALRHEFGQAMTALDKMLSEQEFIMGDDFSTADIILGHLGGWAKGSGFGADEGRVGEYMSRVRSRPAWKAVLKVAATKSKDG